MTDLQKFLASLSAVYTHPPLTEERLGVYTLMLADLDSEALRGALRLLLADASRQFFPTPGEILAVLRPEPTRAASNNLLGDLEWQVLGHRADLPALRERFGHAAGQAVIACGGLAALRTLDVGQNRPFVEQRFHDALVEEHHHPTPSRLAPQLDARATNLIEVTSRALTAGGEA